MGLKEILIVAIISKSNNRKYPKVGEFYRAVSHPKDPFMYSLLYQVNPATYKKLKKQHYPCSQKSPLCRENKNNVTIVNRPMVIVNNL